MRDEPAETGDFAVIQPLARFGLNGCAGRRTEQQSSSLMDVVEHDLKNLTKESVL
jgi:hypothetical protein